MSCISRRTISFAEALLAASCANVQRNGRTGLRLCVIRYQQANTDRGDRQRKGKRYPGMSCTDEKMHRCLNRLIKLGFAKSSVETPKRSTGILPLALIMPVAWPSIIEASTESKNDFFKTKCELNTVRVKCIWILRAAMLNKRCRVQKHPLGTIVETATT